MPSEDCALGMAKKSGMSKKNNGYGNSSDDMAIGLQ